EDEDEPLTRNYNFDNASLESYSLNAPTEPLMSSPSATSTADALGHGRSKDSNSGNATTSIASQKEKAKTWVCQYTDTRDGWDYCTISGCSQKAGWKNIQNSTSNIIKHL
ncbi:hypothetical protein BGZ81_003579, partial [Podila clonocystis]